MKLTKHEYNLVYGDSVIASLKPQECLIVINYAVIICHYTVSSIYFDRGFLYSNNYMVKIKIVLFYTIFNGFKTKFKLLNFSKIMIIILNIY